MKKTSSLPDEATQPVTVDLNAGTLMGYTNRDVHTFLGIEYAESSRFQQARPVPAWGDVRTALVYGPACPAGANDRVEQTQFVNLSGTNLSQNEDCLFANVWTTSTEPDAKKPVILWIHGGTYSTGAANELSFYNGHNLATTEEAVFVSVNHRLNVLGYSDFAEYGEDYADSGNLGQLDLVEALRWVNNNIEKFGGDPDNVTLVGQSGGGGKVLTLLGMPEAEGLFHRAVAMSPATMWRSQQDAQEQAQELLEELDVAEPADVQELSYQDLHAAAQTIGMEHAPVTGTQAFPEETFTVGGDFTELASDIPLLVTTVLGEFSSNLGDMSYAVHDPDDPMQDAYQPGLTDHRVDELLTQSFGDHADEVVEAFEQTYPGHPRAHVLWMEQGPFFGHTRNAVLDAKTGHEQAPAFAAVFARPLPVFGGVTPPHTGGDVPFLLRNDDAMEHIVAGEDAEFREYSRSISDSLLRFAATGDPSSDSLSWPAYTEESQSMMVFDRDIRVQDHHESDLYRLFAEIAE
ncbi:carboxylesterase/lipase family protein [Nesterenkonia haasae]|uniref:carboxylesterase/lipase family protein n=1 Tax=Nesterenkonia haasae TaxID=2587813 RepID=UPI00139141ED|nr:carboxylesterase family protein [Nesterenkonia haasae]